MLKFLIYILLPLSLLGVFGVTTPAHAQEATPSVFLTTPDPLASRLPFDPDLGYSDIKSTLPFSRITNVGELLSALLGSLNFIVAALALFGLIFTGIMYITAGGDMDKADKARKNIVWIITGIAIYIGFILMLSIFRNTLIDFLGRLNLGVTQ